MRSRRRHGFEPSRRPAVVPPLNLFGGARIPPGGSSSSSPNGQLDSRVITHMQFVELFMSGSLSFSDSKEEYKFTADDLKDLGEIGHGRFGVVHKMLHEQSNHLMAVKKVRLTMTTFDDNEDKKLIQQLKNEVNTIKDAASCKEVVAFYGVTFKEGDCMICMELMDISLERTYNIVHALKEKFDEDVLGIVGVTVLNALNGLKKLKGIMHRDVKPSNILLSLQGEVKLCDFGISGYLENSIAKTKDVGCRPYMAPERLDGSQDSYDIRADVWSLGITLLPWGEWTRVEMDHVRRNKWEMGPQIEVARTRFPYPGFENQSVFAQIRQVVYGDPQVLTAADGFSAKTACFVNECLTKEYNQRPNFETLMESSFYTYFNDLHNKTSIIANYLQRMYEFNSQMFS